MSRGVDIAVIGGGAAGFFAAIHAASHCHGRVAIFEKTKKWLSKVRISGGGRCNVTHGCYEPSSLVQYYPRGGKKLYKPFKQFATRETVEWFEKRGITLKTEEDGRIFPITDSSETVIDCLIDEAKNVGVEMHAKSEVVQISPLQEGFSLTFKGGAELTVNQVILGTGGHPKPENYNWLTNLGLSVVSPFPSLFTFNVPDSGLNDLQGLSVHKGSARLAGTKLKQEGPILITHWGFSGPAIIKLSAFGALELYNRNYQFPFLINWCNLEEEDVRNQIKQYRIKHPKKIVLSNPMFNLPSRLWKRQCEKAGLDPNKPFSELGKKQINRLVEYLVRDPYQANGKSTFKEEFVTAGGVELREVNTQTFESKKLPGLYLTGELLNVDAVTGGFNFQHAWTSGYLAGISAAKKHQE